MRHVLTLVLVLLSVADADAQLFRRRDRYQPYCPGPYCPTPGMPSAPYKPIPNAPATPAEPEIPVELEQVIPVELRYRNPGIECAYIAAEEILVAAGYEEFRGWGTSLPNGGRGYGREMGFILKALDDRGVPYKAVRNGDTSIFEHARKEGVGVYVQVPGHALVVVGLDDRHAYVINNYTAAGPASVDRAEQSSKKVQRWSREKFMRIWEGTACCPLRKRKRPDAGPQLPAPPIPRPEAPTLPTPGPAGPQGPPGPPGKDGASVDTAARVQQISALIDRKLDERLAVDHVKVVEIEKRLAILEGRPTKLATRIVQVSPQ
jgi:hypothetical protein